MSVDSLSNNSTKISQNKTTGNHLFRVSEIGTRDTNEDVEMVKLNFPSFSGKYDKKFSPVDLMCIFDGHGGDAVSKFASRYIVSIFTSLKYGVYPMSKIRVKQIFNFIQDKLIEHKDNIAAECGSTALIVVRYQDKEKNPHLQVINLGDCRAVLSRNGIAMALTKDHKPYWPDEKVRINKVNTNPENIKRKIYFDKDENNKDDEGSWRVGDLSVSRSFGDLDNVPHVTHIPDMFDYACQPEDEFIILACDGLWDVMSNDEVVNFIRDHYKNNYLETYKTQKFYPDKKIRSTDCIAKKLAQYAIAKGSKDNISIIIMFFKTNVVISECSAKK